MHIAKDIKVSRPVISSSSAADQSFQHWLDQNNYHLVRDRDGTDWQVLVVARLEASERNSSRRGWLVTLNATTDVDAGALTTTGILDLFQDERLLRFLGEKTIPLRMRPISFHADSEEGVKNWLLEQIPKVKTHLQTTELGLIKRAMLSKWVNQSCTFGSLDR